MIGKSGLRGRVLAALVVGCALAGAAAGASAQCIPRDEVERATALIERAREAVDRSPLPEAVELLRAAERRRSEAAGEASHGRREQACRMALLSQKLAEKAAERALRGSRGLAELRNILDRTEESLRESLDRVAASGSPEARRLLVAARDQEVEARRAFDRRRPRVALRLTLMARNTAERAVRIADGHADHDPKGVAGVLDDTDRLIEEAGRVLGGGDARGTGEAGELMRRAEAMQAEARRQAGAGRPALALQFTRQARFLVTQALGRVDVVVNPEDVEALIGSAADLLAQLRAGGNGDGRESDLLVRAEKLLDDARSALAEKRYGPALASVRAAGALALDVAGRLFPDGRD
jgi:HEPN domain-containing protein